MGKDLVLEARDLGQRLFQRQARIAGGHEPVGQHPVPAEEHEGVGSALVAEMREILGQGPDPEHGHQHSAEALSPVDGDLEGQDRGVVVGTVDRRDPDRRPVRSAVAESSPGRLILRDVEPRDPREGIGSLGQHRLAVVSDIGDGVDGGICGHRSEKQAAHAVRIV